ncbi:STAS domain-containing protein [Streptomyces sp. NPDC097617]|uniref:STAS domain-containing protein n=1 Tax=Streptomyces sp. NPDC097617 TaxID=3366091 RepID=UPI003827B7C7
MTTALIDLKTVTHDDRGLRIALAGELDCYTSEQVGPSLCELAASDYPNVVLDLCDLSFCDTAGIDLLLLLNRRCRASGTRLLLCDVPLLVIKSMRVLGADRELQFVVS